MIGQIVEVLGLLRVELQRSYQRGEHLLGRDEPPLLDPGVVVGADRRELRHLLAPQPAHPAALVEVG